VVWECREKRCSYHILSGNSPLYEDMQQETTPRYGHYEMGRCLDGEMVFPWRVNNPHKIWRALVVDYSRRALANPTDKLAALSGLAAAMKPQFKSDYLAGL
jgi:hypothetical protein